MFKVTHLAVMAPSTADLIREIDATKYIRDDSWVEFWKDTELIASIPANVILAIEKEEAHVRS